MGPFVVSVHLAIESSQRCGGVAVRSATGMVRTIALESASGVDDQLMPAIKQLFDEVGAQPQDLSLIGVSIGPGGFTGLRVAVSTARTLAMTTGCRVVAVPSAIVAAMGYSETEGDVAILLAGRRDSVWLTRVGPDHGIVGKPGLVCEESVASAIAGCVAVLGDEHVPQPLQEAVAAAHHALTPPQWDPLVCLQAAERAAAGGQYADPRTLEPLYPRPPEAVRLFQAR